MRSTLKKTESKKTPLSPRIIPQSPERNTLGDAASSFILKILHLSLHVNETVGVENALNNADL